MEYHNLGRTGLKVSELCLGTMNFGWTADEASAYQVFDAAFEAGINFIDTADVYSRWHPGNPGGIAETYVGNWLTASHKPREQLVIATKVRARIADGPNDEGLGRVHIMDAVHASLRRLQTDYVDLYQAHSPDDNVPIEETLRAFDDLVRQGKVRYVGASNYPAWKLMKALWVSDKLNIARYDCLQPRYNAVHRGEFERELQAVCATEHLGVIPYAPLQGGFLTGKYRAGQAAPKESRGQSSSLIQRYMKDERAFTVVNRLEEIGKNHSKSVAQTAIAWLQSNPVVTSPIIGANNTAQLKELLGSVGFRLTAEENKSINDLTSWQML